MKKLLSVLITTALLLSFAACGGSGDSSSKETSAEASVQSSEKVDSVSSDEQASTDASFAESADSSEATVSKDSSEDKPSGGTVNDSSATSDASGIESIDNSADDSSAPDSSVADSSASDSSEDNSSAVTTPTPSDKNTYTVNVTKNSDGTYTVTALLPEKAESGKIVVSTSSKLTMVKGSLSTSIQSGLANESYKRNGIVGAAVAFASIAPLAKGTVAFKATYTAADGAVIAEGDVTVPEWNISAGGKSLGNNKTSDVIINYVS